MSKLKYDENGRIIFTEAMRQEYTILVPQMAPYHFEYLVDALNAEGYHAELLRKTEYSLIHEGMKYSHNDICIPAMLVIGQFIDAVKKKELNDEKVALIITQTGGGCRASNYIALLRKALKKAKLEHVPVISLNANGFEKNPGFKLSARLLHKLHEAIVFGDLMMTLVHQSRPYENKKGSVTALKESIDQELKTYFEHNRRFSWRYSKKKIASILNRFKALDLSKTPRPKVGIVGEIYVKFSPLGNNHLEETLEKEGVEVVIPPLYDFFLYSFDSRAHDIKRYGGPKKERFILNVLVKYVEYRRQKVRNMIEAYGFEAPVSYNTLKSFVNNVIDVGTHSGEGWLLTAEMIDLIKHGAPNIVCTQPFGCLPNHIAGKGMFKKIKHLFPESNIVAIDYDTSASELNQVNRINLMVSNAFRTFQKKGE